MSLICTPSGITTSIQSVTNAKFDKPHRVAAMLYGLSLAVLSRTGSNYTTLASLKSASKDWVSQPTYKLEEFNGWIALNQALAEQDAGGSLVAFPNVATALLILNEWSNGMSQHEMMAAETFLRCNLTII